MIVFDTLVSVFVILITKAKNSVVSIIISILLNLIFDSLPTKYLIPYELGLFASCDSR